MKFRGRNIPAAKSSLNSRKDGATTAAIPRLHTTLRVCFSILACGPAVFSGPALLRDVADASFLLAQLFLGLFQIGLSAFRIFGL